MHLGFSAPVIPKDMHSLHLHLNSKMLELKQFKVTQG